jgi:hypothetical protein
MISTYFTHEKMTEMIYGLPDKHRQIRALDLFLDVPIKSNTAIVEINKLLPTILPTKPWGYTGTVNVPSEAKYIIVPCTSLNLALMPTNIVGVNLSGPGRESEHFKDMVEETLQQTKDAFDMTDEYRKAWALQGRVLDSDGTTELFNSYSEFGGTREPFDFRLGDTSKDNIEMIIRKLQRHVEKNLMGETMTHLMVLVGPTFFDRLVNHPYVNKIYLLQAIEAAKLGTSLEASFKLEGVIFEEYRFSAPNPDGTGTIQILPDDAGMAFPIGTRNTFKRFIAPADYLDTTETVGKRYYAHLEMMPDSRGISLCVQSNTLPICCRPNLLAGVWTSN